MKNLSIILLALFMVSCASITPEQDHKLKEWEAQNIVVENKSPTAAALLNVLPGIGDFYNGNIGYGVANLLTWPLSVLWAPVGGAHGAKVNNYYATKVKVSELESKKDMIKEELESALMSGKITRKQFHSASKRLKRTPLKKFLEKVSYEDFVMSGNNRIPASASKN